MCLCKVNNQNNNIMRTEQLSKLDAWECGGVWCNWEWKFPSGKGGGRGRGVEGYTATSSQSVFTQMMHCSDRSSWSHVKLVPSVMHTVGTVCHAHSWYRLPLIQLVQPTMHIAGTVCHAHSWYRLLFTQLLQSTMHTAVTVCHAHSWYRLPFTLLVPSAIHTAGNVCH
jgi:hypothetical protein